MTYISNFTWGPFFLLGTPLWPWPVISMYKLKFLRLQAYTSMPQPLFGAKDVCYIEEKVAK